MAPDLIEIALLLSVLLPGPVVAGPSVGGAQEAPFPVEVVLRPLRQTFLRGEHKALAADFTIPPSREASLDWLRIVVRQEGEMRYVFPRECDPSGDCAITDRRHERKILRGGRPQTLLLSAGTEREWTWPDYVDPCNEVGRYELAIHGAIRDAGAPGRGVQFLSNWATIDVADPPSAEERAALDLLVKHGGPKAVWPQCPVRWPVELAKEVVQGARGSRAALITSGLLLKRFRPGPIPPTMAWEWLGVPPYEPFIPVPIGWAEAAEALEFLRSERERARTTLGPRERSLVAAGALRAARLLGRQDLVAEFARDAMEVGPLFLRTVGEGAAAGVASIVRTRGQTGSLALWGGVSPDSPEWPARVEELFAGVSGAFEGKGKVVGNPWFLWRDVAGPALVLLGELGQCPGILRIGR